MGGVTTHYLYDLGGNLIAEADGGTGAVTAEYVALEGKPLAFIATGAIYWVHGDHLGTPQMLTDAAGARGRGESAMMLEPLAKPDIRL